MNVLVTGSNGQLGSEIKELSKKEDINFRFTDVIELDITNYREIEKFFLNHQFEIIINCAAYTAVDKAETEKEKARQINSYALKNLARIANKTNALLIHISTDFVFDGKKNTPYTEIDKPNPLSIYGKTKLEGEKIALKEAKNLIILRTSWLYSSYGNNFVKTIIKNAREKKNLRVVYDQVGTPTYARDLAQVIISICKKNPKKIKEIFHYSNEGVTSWFDFAKNICELSDIRCEITPILTSEYPSIAKRPHYSVLNKSKIKTFLDIQIPYWKDSLKECVKKLEGEI
ncbi:MAG: dTDP-4-dehydrorhamnose reductase [Brevinematales bacterium]|nr:dTDP-4-dehydrorhamnose reductase [Brevinematales bacterium]